jgi:hypothetical protein
MVSSLFPSELQPNRITTNTMTTSVSIGAPKRKTPPSGSVCGFAQIVKFTGPPACWQRWRSRGNGAHLFYGPTSSPAADGIDVQA